ncbi:hypothetical protein ACH5RR_017718 [Cinchona calisaya]|uniref:Glabrous enhancer-binding protein-like DBD domain-containing protein n=1 Tax=Cinchona calisaya TaxID=153742 RepID=A0ABD2ZJD8_9GENT
MAKPREPAKPDPPPESEEEEESGEEEDSEDEEGSESESEPEDSQKKASSTPAPAPKKPEPSTQKTQPTPADSSSSEDEESGSDTDSENPAQKPDPNIKPLASKSMDEPLKTTTTKKPRSKPNSSSGPTSPTKPTSGAGAKRPASAAAGTGGDEGKDAKRSKRKPDSEADSSEKKGNSNDDSRKLFQRLWSEDDEIAILKGMLDYSAKKKADPVTDLNAFLEFIKKNLHLDFSRTQLQDKIRRLKKKYEKNAEKEKKDNKERTFTKPHEQKAYDLSKKVWGSEKNVGGEETIESPKVNGTVVRKSRSKGPVGTGTGTGTGRTTPKVDLEEKLKEVKDVVSGKKVVEGLKNVSFGLDSLRIEEWVLKNGADLIKDEKKRAELEEKWRELKVKEIELFARRSELMAEQTKLILDGLK